LQRFDDKPVHFVNVRVAAVGKVGHVPLAEVEAGGPDPSGALKATTQTLFWDEGNQPAEFTTNVYDRDRLKAVNRRDGAAIVEQCSSTAIIGPGQRATVGRVGHNIVETSDNSLGGQR